MTIEKMNFHYPKGNIQSVYSHEEMTALELAAATSGKVDECIEMVNGVEQSAIEATQIVDVMRNAQDNFILDNDDARVQIIIDNQEFIETLETSKMTFEADLTTTKETFVADLTTTKETFVADLTTTKETFVADLTATKETFETDMSTAVNNIIANAENSINADVNEKIDLLVNDGTIDGIINQQILGDVKENLISMSNDISVLNNQRKNIITLTPTGGDDTNIIQTAINTLVNGGCIEFKDGDYNLTTELSSLSNITYKATGKVRLLSDHLIFKIDSGSNVIANNIKNIKFDGLTFEAITKLFQEHTNLISINGVSNVEFNNCKFVGFRSDGVYIGSGLVLGQERHNTDIKINKCLFDGVNKQNRNAISILDGDGVYIDECVFKNCTTPTMPGAIDIEPNEDLFAIVKNIHINKCRFYDIGGNTGVINVALPLSQTVLTTPIQNITISNNYIDSATGYGIAIKQFTTEIINNSTPDINIKIQNNEIKNVGLPFSLSGVKGVKIINNQFENTFRGALVGYTGDYDKLIDITIKDNQFIMCGYGSGTGLEIFTVDSLNIIGNIFNDIGLTSANYGIGILFMQGISSNIRLLQNTFISPTGKLKVAIGKEPSHTFTRTTNADQNNIYNGLGVFFDADIKMGGGIVDKGSNINGSFIKFEDGTLICRGVIDIDASAGPQETAFPYQFNNADISLTLTNMFVNVSNVLWTTLPPTTIGFSAYPIINGDIATVATKASYIAIGNWN